MQFLRPRELPKKKTVIAPQKQPILLCERYSGSSRLETYSKMALIVPNRLEDG
jgi:hypothetical protein